MRVVESHDPNWWKVTTVSGKTGFAPATYLELVDDGKVGANTSKNEEGACTCVCVREGKSKLGKEGKEKATLNWI